MIIGIGIDLCELDRFRTTLQRTPAIADRILASTEQNGSVQSRAGRFAAKEALAKALGAPPGLVWTDAEVTYNEHGQPSFLLSGTVAARALELGVQKIHISITHDAGIAVAVVVCEG